MTSQGSFIRMNDGLISSNTAIATSGGVNMSGNSTFSQTGGSVYGNTATGSGGVYTYINGKMVQKNRAKQNKHPGLAPAAQADQSCVSCDQRNKNFE